MPIPCNSLCFIISVLCILFSLTPGAQRRKDVLTSAGRRDVTLCDVVTSHWRHGVVIWTLWACSARVVFSTNFSTKPPVDIIAKVVKVSLIW